MFDAGGWAAVKAATLYADHYAADQSRMAHSCPKSIILSLGAGFQQGQRGAKLKTGHLIRLAVAPCTRQRRSPTCSVIRRLESRH